MTRNYQVGVVHYLMMKAKQLKEGILELLNFERSALLLELLALARQFDPRFTKFFPVQRDFFFLPYDGFALAQESHIDQY